MAFTKYPITDYNNLNVDWIIESTKQNLEETAELSDRVTMLESNVEAQVDQWLEDEKPEIVQDVIDSVGALSRLRNFVLIGDSFSIGITPGIGTYDGIGWADWCKTWIEQYTNSKVWTSRGLVAPGNSGFASTLPYSQHLTYVAGLMTDDEKASITDIIVLGGSNDLAYLASVEPAIAAFMAQAKATFPNAQVKIGWLGSNIYGMYNARAYYESCRKYGAVYISDTLPMMCDPAMISSDSLHLTQAGYLFYAPYVLQAVLSGHCDYAFRFLCEQSFSNGSLNIPDAGFNFTVTPHALTLEQIGSNGGDASVYVTDYRGNTGTVLVNMGDITGAPRIVPLTSYRFGHNIGYMQNSQYPHDTQVNSYNDWALVATSSGSVQLYNQRFPLFREIASGYTMKAALPGDTWTWAY